MTAPIPPALLAVARRYYEAKTALDIARRCEESEPSHIERLERRVQETATDWATLSHSEATPLALTDLADTATTPVTP